MSNGRGPTTDEANVMLSRTLVSGAGSVRAGCWGLADARE